MSKWRRNIRNEIRREVSRNVNMEMVISNNFLKEKNKRRERRDKWWGDNMRLEIDFSVYSRMSHICRLAKGEISGMGKVERAGKRMTVTGLRILRQKCSAAYTRIGRDEITELMADLISSGEDHAKWRLWWHTHNDFWVGWSDTDIRNIRDILSLAPREYKGHLVSVCMNKDMEMTARIDTIDNTAKIPVYVRPDNDEKLRADCLRTVKSMVEKMDFKKEAAMANTIEVMDT